MGVSIGATTVESPDQVSTVRIPSEYADLALTFCKKRATKLPPHRRGDCAIKLLVDVVLHRSHVYPLSQEETAAGAGIHSAFHFTCLLEFLFCEEEGWGSAPMY